MRVIFARILRLVANANKSGDAVRLNTFDENSIGFFKGEAVYLFASISRFAPVAVREVIGEDGKMVIPCAVMPKGNKPDPFAYAFSQFLLEDGGFADLDVTPDRVGLINVSVGKTEYRGLWKVKPEWLQKIANIEDITVVIENDIEGDVIEISRVAKDENKTVYMRDEDVKHSAPTGIQNSEKENKDTSVEQPIPKTVENQASEEVDNINTDEGEDKEGEMLSEESSSTVENTLSAVVGEERVKEILNPERVNITGFKDNELKISEKEAVRDIMENVLDSLSDNNNTSEKIKEREKKNKKKDKSVANNNKLSGKIISSQDEAWDALTHLYKKSKFVAKRPWAIELFTIREGKKVINSSVLKEMKKSEISTVKSIIMNIVSVHNCSEDIEQFYKDLADKITQAWKKLHSSEPTTSSS